MQLAVLLLLLPSFAAAATSNLEGSCISSDPALVTLSKSLSPRAAISCRGSRYNLYTAGRYWGTQYGKQASVAIFPSTAQDVSAAVIAASSSPLAKNDFAFVSGAHGMTSASTGSGFLIDLTLLNTTQVVRNAVVDDTTIPVAVAYGPGATAGSVEAATAGSGWTSVQARDSTVGAGGFTAGGGVGFLANAYGLASDRVRAYEVVLMSGEIVYATKTNKYADLFWALQGGQGQFAVVTRFWQEAAPEPSSSHLRLYIPKRTSYTLFFDRVAKFFTENTDPLSLMYFCITTGDSMGTSRNMTQATVFLTALQFKNASDPRQASFDSVFNKYFADVPMDSVGNNDVPYSRTTDLIDPFFPYGSRRGFYGPQTTNITGNYLASAYGTFQNYLSELRRAGERFTSTGWVVQYQMPTLNGHAPKTNDATGWPHSVVGHQTLFSPAWQNARNDATMSRYNDQFNALTWGNQAKLSPGVLADYPNYQSPGLSGKRVYGDNLPRLVQVKEKYDPNCRLSNGPTFATKACVAKGVANLYK